MDPYAKAKTLGILTEYIDGQGHRRVTDPAALRAILEALPPQSPRRLIEQPVVVRLGRDATTRLSDAAASRSGWKILNGLKVIAEGEARDRTIRWPQDLAEGVYRLQLSDSAEVREELPLIVAPAQAFGGDFDRGWLLAVQLYGVRSARNWGMGDFTTSRA